LPDSKTCNYPSEIKHNQKNRSNWYPDLIFGLSAGENFKFLIRNAMQQLSFLIFLVTAPIRIMVPLKLSQRAG
jgi:hypothetical protein